MRRLLIPIYALLAGFATSGFSATAYENVILAADKWCPYSCDENSANPGFMVEIATEALKPYNIHVQYMVMSWARAIDQARSGKIDGIIGATHGDAPDFVYPDYLQGMSSMQFWVKKNSTWQYDSIASLGKVRIGTITGYSYGKVVDLYLKMHMSEGRIQPVNDQDGLAANLQRLNAGVIDTLPEEKSVMQYYYASRSLPIDIRPAGIVSDAENPDDNYLYIAFGPNKPKAKYYADLIGKRVMEMRRDGSLAKILAKYKVDDWYRTTGK